MTCGALEENAADNRVMARALAAQGYPVGLDEGRDLHNFTAWRDAWDPHLTRLLQRGMAMRREQVEIEAPSIGGRGHGDRLRALRPAACCSSPPSRAAPGTSRASG